MDSSAKKISLVFFVVVGFVYLWVQPFFNEALFWEFLLPLEGREFYSGQAGSVALLAKLMGFIFNVFQIEGLRFFYFILFLIFLKVLFDKKQPFWLCSLMVLLCLLSIHINPIVLSNFICILVFITTQNKTRPYQVLGFLSLLIGGIFSVRWVYLNPELVEKRFIDFQNFNNSLEIEMTPDSVLFLGAGLCVAFLLVQVFKRKQSYNNMEILLSVFALGISLFSKYFQLFLLVPYFCTFPKMSEINACCFLEKRVRPNFLKAFSGILGVFIVFQGIYLHKDDYIASVTSLSKFINEVNLRGVLYSAPFLNLGFLYEIRNLKVVSIPKLLFVNEEDLSQDLKSLDREGVDILILKPRVSKLLPITQKWVLSFENAQGQIWVRNEKFCENLEKVKAYYQKNRIFFDSTQGFSYLGALVHHAAWLEEFEFLAPLPFWSQSSEEYSDVLAQLEFLFLNKAHGLAIHRLKEKLELNPEDKAYGLKLAEFLVRANHLSEARHWLEYLSTETAMQPYLRSYWVELKRLEQIQTQKSSNPLSLSKTFERVVGTIS